jgi:elongator complex protein 1
LPHLSQFTSEHRTAAQSLQDDLKLFELELTEALEEIWAKPVENLVETDTWALRMEEKEKDRLINATDKVSKPELSRGVDWRMRLLDLERDTELKLDAAAIS